MSNSLSRREMIRLLGLAAAGAMIPSKLVPNPFGIEPLIMPDDPPFVPDKPVTAITLGAGARGNTYGNYAIQFPDQLKIVGVAEPNPIRNERYARKHDISPGNRFNSWEEVFERSKFADAIIITTPDDLHYGPAMAALAMGYDLLLEKPIAPTEKECRDILAQAQKTGRIVAVCHVLRYAPYFIRLRNLIQSGAIGRLVSIQHMEPIEHVHMSHSFVRGNWHNSRQTAPIILAKSCHDLDILRWLVDKSSKRVQAFGQLSWFREENAPQGAPARCTDGCPAEANCPYSALRIYYRNRTWLYVFDLPDEKEKHGEAILNYLKTTNYGRCVYRMDNDQCDHYVSNIEFETGITASFSMDAFTPWGGRRTRVMGSMGFIEGDMDQYTFYDFRTGEKLSVESKAIEIEEYKHSGHGGGDWRLVADFVKAVAKQDPNLLTSTIAQSIESHIMAFAAEKSRLGGQVEPITL
ncbi:MAG: Gfo/Idh/MocA family oxidoreductase [Bacteroidetes bacterium]|nr:Gfo/Idh/MocA family oxidoreductase [Bacteroidota bacterium]